MAQTEANDVKPSLGEITRETPAIDLQFEETTVQRVEDGVLLQIYREDNVRMYEITFKPTPSFCVDIDRLFETIKIAVSQQDPDVRLQMEERTDGVQLHLLVTVKSSLGVDHRRLTARASVVNEERSMWHRMSKEVRRLREKNATLESRLEHFETTPVVFAVGNQSQSWHCSTQLVCNKLYVPIESNITYFENVLDNVRAEVVHLVQHTLFRDTKGQVHQFSIDAHTVFRNKHATQLILEVTPGCVTAGYNGSGPTACWEWVHKVLGNFPKCEVVTIIGAGSHPPDSVIKEFAHLKFVFRAVGPRFMFRAVGEGCPESWRCIAERSKNVSIEYTS